MSTKRTDIVLVDSDEDVLPAAYKVPRTTDLMTASHLELSSDDDELDTAAHFDTGESQLHPHTDDKGNSHETTHVNGFSDSTSEFGSSSSSSPRDLLLAPISVEEYRAAVAEAAADAGDTRTPADGAILLQDPTQVPAEERLATRRYLKTHGIMEFLDHYLPTTASADDILSLIFKLGFLPKDVSDYSNDDDNLIRLIQVLNMAMKTTLTLRTRLPDFSTVNSLLGKLQTASKIMVITGAGISTSLGIPDFRSSQGFYTQLQHLGLSDPQEVFDLDFFHQDPSIFYLIAHLILPPEDAYTPLHAFLKLLQDKGKLLRNYTQNIDNLEGVVGISPDKLIQCHGSFAMARCVTCGHQVPGELIFPQIRAKELAYCVKCNAKRLRLLKNESVHLSESYGVMKPEITFFGEPLPSRFHRMIKQDINECDLLICIGTSLKVAPVLHILDRVPEEVPQVLINRDRIDHFNLDLSILGYCDDAAAYLCDRLGWDLAHPDYQSLLHKDGGLMLEGTDEPAVYRLVHKGLPGEI